VGGWVGRERGQGGWVDRWDGQMGGRCVRYDRWAEGEGKGGVRV
jgi:hypothetical protein